MKVVVLDDYQRQAHAMTDWGRLGPEVQVQYLHEVLTGAALVQALREAQVVVAMRERTAFPAEVLAQLPALRLLVTTGMRNASIDLAACARQGITVCGTGVSGSPAAELTWALILAAAKHLPWQERALREGQWQTSIPSAIEGKRLGVLGLGKLGTRVARIGLAFGMDVVAWSPNLTDERAAQAQVRRVDKHTLFAESDYVSLHLVLSARSRHIVGAQELAAMPRHAWLINTSRAGLVDEQALLQVLREGRIGGAGLDVFEREPLPADDPLVALPNTVLTPHLGYVTRESYAVYYRDAVDDILAWREGKPLRELSA